MGYLWRRRASLVKIVILLSAVWFTIAFLIYSEDRRPLAQSHSLPLQGDAIKDGIDNHLVIGNHERPKDLVDIDIVDVAGDDDNFNSINKRPPIVHHDRNQHENNQIHQIEDDKKEDNLNGELFL